jgi:hypothetical protein
MTRGCRGGNKGPCVPRESCGRDLPVLWGVAGSLVGRMACRRVLLRDRNSGPLWWVFWLRGWRTGGSAIPWWCPQQGHSQCGASMKGLTPHRLAPQSARSFVIVSLLAPKRPEAQADFLGSALSRPCMRSTPALSLLFNWHHRPCAQALVALWRIPGLGRDDH